MRSLTVLLLMLGFATVSFAQEEATAASSYNDGLAKLKAKDYAAALPLMEKAIELADPESETDAKVIGYAKRNGAIAAYYVGGAHRKAKEYDAAIEAFKKGMDMNPDFYANYIGYAQALDGKGDDMEAVKAYVGAAGVAAKSAKTKSKAEDYISAAETKIKNATIKKEYDESIALGKAYMEARGEEVETYSPRFHYYFGTALKEKGEVSDALAHADKAISALGEEDDSSRYYLLKGECHQALGQKAEAIDAYKMVKSGDYKKVADYNIQQLSQ
jgi:tetratricopeptide (TPR) repeat protein